MYGGRERGEKKTGSLYGFADAIDEFASPEKWFTVHITADGNHIVVRVDDRVAVDFVDQRNTYKDGYVALQSHTGVVRYENISIKPLP